MARVGALNILLAWLSTAMAAGIFYHFNFNLKPYMDPLKDACGLGGGEPKGTPPEFFKLGVGFLDSLHCLLTPFFLDCVSTAAGRFFILETLAVCVPLMALMGLEESRTSARGLVRSAFAVLALSQLLGVSVAVPALWVPSYLLLTRANVEGAFLPAGKVPAIGVAAVLATLLTGLLAAAGRFPPEAAQKLVVNFNLLLPCLALLWTLSPGGRAPGNAAAGGILRLCAGLSLLLHAAAVADMQQSYGGPAAAWAAVRAVAEKATPGVMPANFMLFDFLGALGAALVVTLADEGLAGLAGVLGVGVVAGPGAAFALVLAKREARLARGAAAEPPAQTPEEALAVAQSLGIGRRFKREAGGDAAAKKSD